MQLSIIIVNYKVRFFLEQCLYSVLAATQHLTAEIIVVDNQSGDESLAYLRPRFPGVYFMENARNEGFGKANNQALAHAKGQWVLFLNPDTLLPEDGLQKCIAFMEQNSDAGALGIRMLDGSGNFLKESKRAFPAATTAFYKLFGFSALFPRSKIFSRYHLGHLDDLHNHRIDVLAGAFMLVRKTVLDRIGGFDERFFMYGEDVDLSYRIQHAGWTNYYFSGASIIHFKGESTKKGDLNYVRLFYGAMMLFVKKHYSHRRSFIFMPLIQLAIAARAAMSVLSSMGKAVFNPSGAGRAQKDGMPLYWLVGSEAAMASAAALLKAAHQKHAITRQPEQLPQGALLVFCIDPQGFTMESVLPMMGFFKHKYQYFFHYIHSGNIINSHSKDVNGEALTLPPLTLQPQDLNS